MSNGVKGFAALPILVACVVTARVLAADFVIAQSDEDDIIALAESLNEYVSSVTNPVSSNIPFDKYKESPIYKKLLEYDHKLIPYLARQFQLENDSRVIVGSALADRPIKSLEDLYSYQGERAARIRKDVAPWFDHFLAYCLIADTTVGQELEQAGVFRKPRTPWSERFSWIEWWEKHKERFEFRTKEPLTIETTHKYYSHPHVSTEVRDGLLYMEAVHATYPQMIERAAAEMGVFAFVGEHPDMRLLSTVRMRGVTFDEFAYLIGRTASVDPFPCEKIGERYHFGDVSVQAKPRPIFHGWGIMMGRTVFREGDDVAVVVITRGTGGIVDPRDPVFPAYGSFKVTTNTGEVVHDYREQTNPEPTRPLLQRERDSTEIEINLRTYCDLPPGEYNVQFRYGRDETPPIAIEVYPRSDDE